ncbi:hypothetical protein NE237_027561 [Protea cynaroides]|uniref:Uncharacterized protein n=1 Tax=Protea cynaroides TaxID=273540 RepID=A0A9Q0GNS4_9MAGN|nr:hypothetical protein NE237_027561 [Protea cynaroides]
MVAMVPSPLILNWFFHLITLSFILAFLLFSLFTLAFIFHFHLKARNNHYLRDFNSLWAVRTLLVSFIALWALTESLRLPLRLIHRSLFIHFPFLPHLLTLQQQANLCRIHVVLSLGLFEPGFLATLLFLVNVSVSIRQRNHTATTSTALYIVSAYCLPNLLLQVLFVYFPASSSKYTRLPEALSHSFVFITDGGDGNNVLCAYPLSSSISFGAFGVGYALSFLLSSWRVISLVINKGLRVRIYVLSLAVLLALPTQILFLAIFSVLLNPYDLVFQGLALLVFLCVLSCAVVAVGILVIWPIGDSLAVAGGMCGDRPASSAAETDGIGFTGEEGG